MGFATLLIGRLEGAVGFVSRMVFHAPAHRRVLRRAGRRGPPCRRSPDAAATRPRRRARCASSTSPSPIPAARASCATSTFAAPPGPAPSRWSARPARASPPPWRCCSGCGTRSEGRITLDGHDLRDITLESLRRNIGVVFQERMLFNRTIRDNLLVGRPDATQEEIERACRMAEAHDFITRQPQGYDTMVGERGVDALGRPAPAPGDRARAAEGPAGADPGRGDQRARRRDRGARAEGADGADGRAHHLHHRPPPVHRARRRRDPGLRGRPAWPSAAPSTRWSRQDGRFADLVRTQLAGGAAAPAH